MAIEICGLPTDRESELPYLATVEALTCDYRASLVCRAFQAFFGRDFIKVRRRIASEGWVYCGDGTHKCPECKGY